MNNKIALFSLFCVIIGSLFTSQFSIAENDSSAVDFEDKKHLIPMFQIMMLKN